MGETPGPWLLLLAWPILFAACTPGDLDQLASGVRPKKPPATKTDGGVPDAGGHCTTDTTTARA